MFDMGCAEYIRTQRYRSYRRCFYLLAGLHSSIYLIWLSYTENEERGFCTLLLVWGLRKLGMFLGYEFMGVFGVKYFSILVEVKIESPALAIASK